jgi:iron complex transport system permease protein
MLRSRFIFIVICLGIASVTLSLYKGSTPASLYQLLFNENGQFSPIFLQLRLPRTLAAFTCGSLLALAGTLLQLLLQNPIADPYALGISSGAAFFALLMMWLGFGEIGLMGGAWLGSLLTMLLIILLARKHHWHAHTLLLSGIALASLFSAGISFILLMSPETNLHGLLFWLTGDLNGANFPWLPLIILSIGSVCAYCLAPGFNILGRGESAAQSLGLQTKHYRVALFLLSSLCTAAAVSIAGCIGFIGLIIPHLTRLLVGYDHRITLPLSMLLGGSFLTLADTLARTIITPEQLPVGIIMAMIGVPVFIWVLQK